MLGSAYKRSNAVRTAVFAHDLLAAGLAFLLALSARLGPEALDQYVWTTLWFMAVAGFSGAIVGLNSGIWRYASLADVEAIVKAATITIVLFTISLFIINRLDNVPRATILMAWPLMIGFLGGSRIAYRMHRARRARNSDRRGADRNLLLVGLSEGAESFAKAVSERSDLPYKIVGFIDERGRRTGFSRRGIKVLGDLGSLPEVIVLLERRGIPVHGIVVAKSSLFQDKTTLNVLSQAAQRAKVDLLRLPEFTELTPDEISATALEPRPIVLHDLLPRLPIALSQEPVRGLVTGASVIVTGAGGSIGSELSRQLHALRPKRIILVDSSEYLLYLITRELEQAGGAAEIVSRLGNVRDRKQMFALFEECRPEIVFHAAALKHVPIVESQPLEGLATNVIGTRNIADAAAHVSALAMVMVSTDKAINPTNVMGASKRMAETYCQALDLSMNTHFVAVRFGNVLGSAGSVVPLFERQIRDGGPLTVTHPEIERYFMTIPEAVQLVLHATSHGVSARSTQRGRIFMLDMGKPVKIVEIARKMIRLAGFEPDVDIKIEFIGLRPGEKLYEELFNSRESLEATGVPGVLMVSSRHILDGQSISHSLDELATCIEAGDLVKALGVVDRVVPEYTRDPRLARRLERSALQVISGSRS